MGPGSIPFRFWTLNEAWVVKVALTIAGSDPTGGAGIQADLRTFSSFRVHGAAVISSLTIQDTRGMLEVVKIPPEIFRKQLAVLLEDVRVDAVKTGMLIDSETIEITGKILEQFQLTQYVLDPIIRSTSGYRILKEEELDALKKNLFPKAFLLTPNVGEAEALTGLSIRTEEDMERAGHQIKLMGPRYVLEKGGHLKGAALDLLVGGTEVRRFVKPRVRGKRLHGAGCILSASITAGLARGLKITDAVREAKDFVHEAIRSATRIGKGRHVLDVRPKPV